MSLVAPPDTDPGRLLAAWRALRSLRLAEVAERLGTDEATVCVWERGRRRPGLTYAAAIERLTEGQIPAVLWVVPAIPATNGETEPQSATETTTATAGA